ncbi:hypothetical protein [Streptomyces sp. JB150]|uniref:hypothetical protein n=1 Tax=Streptomyces sp. JB150 TaxID=2714844 RepID=UPI00140BCBE8|nr:hypothetical protein [Streptomyces sp. JB150]QIJ63973.1 hypothetical protein G7Z13_19665 [Streptomyces sp. JB150]
MPRGRHRHSPPLHRLLPPSAIAGVSLVCALGPWVFEEPLVLRGLAAAAAVTAVVGAVVMRRWDIQAGKRVAELTRARASDEWRFEERVAELETDLEESRELRQKLEQRLRAKRAELAGLRNEHAALLRRYATAETERASALEGRRLLELEAATPARALPAASGQGVPGQEPVVSEEAESAAEARPAVPALFSPEGARLFRRAGQALARLGADATGEGAVRVPAARVASGDAPEVEAGAGTGADAGTAAAEGAAQTAQAAAEAAPEAGGRAAVEAAPEAGAEALEPVTADAGSVPSPEGASSAQAAPAPQAAPSPKAALSATAARSVTATPSPASPDTQAPPRAATQSGTAPLPQQPTEARAGRGGDAEAAREDEAQGKPEAAAGQEHVAAASDAGHSAPTRPAGHFTVPTAVAVVEPAPARRAATEGGFDFFGTKTKGSSAAMEAVQNEDLADVVGQEALELHKAETESGFRPAGPAAGQAAGQVIDLTAHDKTERIDVQGLRTAAS